MKNGSCLLYKNLDNNLITPEYILSLIQFNANDVNWKYHPKGRDMFCLQAQGASRIYNILEQHKVALLADEVGMGKTIQALSICAALWQENPLAKVLVLVPRDEIVSNWEKEYQTFIRHHYKLQDDIVKAQSGHVPVKKLIRCPNLFDLVKEIQSGWGQFFIGKISSFSNLMSQEAIVERVGELGINNLTRLKNLSANRNDNLNAEIARLLKNEIINHSDGHKPYFDLIIIDEAHYFRHKVGKSLRVQTAEALFGRPEDNEYRPLAKKVLLMTATPNHSSSKDIENIVSYFTKRFKGWEHSKILEEICVRRLRRLGKGSYNKYVYREEKEAESNFNNNPLGEMFFALYQHQLAKQLKEQQEASSGRGVSRMMKYLEGVEFIPFEKANTEENEQEEGARLSSDYSSGSDASILHGLSNKFRDIFGTDPSHPKYEKLVDDLTHQHHGEKAVVFVRRIPSVYEIAKRVMEFYDKQFWSQMQHDEYAALSFEKLDRKSFKRHSQSEIADEDETDEVHHDSDLEEKNIPSSKVMNLFKRVATKSTDATNFRLRFTRSKPGIYTMFFSPGEDYFTAPYQGLISYKYDTSGRQLDNYFNSALLHRTQKIKQLGINKEILSVLLSKQPLADDYVPRKESIPTLITLFWETYLSDETLDQSERDNLKQIYQAYSHYEKEAFSSFIEKGVLNASEAIVWFYEIYRKIHSEEHENVINTYLKFCEEIKAELKTQKLYKQIQESILHFTNIYTKVFSINGETRLLEEKWDSFENAQPIYPYNADNSSKKVLSCFNTPFYPDMLVATSVLQEGVNLQYFCNTVYHYGMAWTPGDNEQRIGRIDRMFGKIERLLNEKQEEARLHIYYPFLKNTIDEEQLRRFIKRKFKEESLIDRGMSNQAEDDFNYNENDNENWKLFLRKPELNEMSDPFPVDISSFNGVSTRKIRTSQTSLEPFFRSIIHAIEEIQQINAVCYFIDKSETPKILIDPTLDGSRKQPVIIELLIDHLGSGAMKQTLYCLQMKTPLASNKKFNELKRKFYESETIQQLYEPGIKLCLDPSNTGGANWGIYMSVELPLFLSQLQENPLSQEEIQRNFLNLVLCADQTEKELFNKDLQKEELNVSVTKASSSSQFQLRQKNKSELMEKWEQRNGYFILENKYPLIANKENEKNSFIYNHENLYLKSFIKNGQFHHQVSHLTEDAQKIELQVLKKHWEVFLRKNL